MEQYKTLVSKIKELWREYLQIDGNEAGGNLHIVIDGGNWDDNSCNFCSNLCFDKEDGGGMYLIKLIMMLPEQHRAQLLENN